MVRRTSNHSVTKKARDGKEREGTGRDETRRGKRKEEPRRHSDVIFPSYFLTLCVYFPFSFLSSAGGIVLSARNGQIVCRNTLDSRLDIAFEQLKPQIRGTLFGFREKIKDSVVEKKHGVSLPK